jgi:uncharacterized protein (TIGR02145 family)
MARNDVLHLLFLDENGVPSTVELIGDEVSINSAPGQVTAIDATSVTSSGFTANWLLVENAEGYYFNLATDPDMTPHVSGYENLNVGNVDHLDITGLTAGVTYYYTLNAYNNVGTSLVSNTITVSLVVAYGALYNWHAVNNVHGVAPAGGHVPTDAEWGILKTSLGGDAVAGGHLKETGLTHWNTPNTGADNTSGFTGLPGGLRSGDDGIFYILNLYGYWHSSDNYNVDTFGWGLVLGYNSTLANAWQMTKNEGASIRCLKNSTLLTNGQSGTVTDIDGNIYPTICIGTQEWMSSNLRTTKYKDGTLIVNIVENTAWTLDTGGAMCWYNNNNT